MDDRNDLGLLHEYVTNGSERAFSALVSRHVDLVFSTAFRQVRNPHLAEEITQAVFIILARKANQLGKGTILVAWLYRTARFAAADALKSEFRRRQREQHALDMETTASGSDLAWSEVAPHLDEALARLADKDRSAILLRYFENRSLRAVGEVLGVEEEAARKRVDRAVSKLRRHLEKHAAHLPISALGGILATHAVQCAPAGLAISASATALAEGGGVSASICALVKAAVQSMLWAKLRRIMAISCSCVLVMAFAFLVAQRDQIPQPHEVLNRHFVASGADKISFRTVGENVGIACMSCHRPGRGQTIFLRELFVEGNWEVPSEALKGTFEIHRTGRDRIIETIRGPGATEFVRGSNGTEGWSLTPDLNVKPLSALELEQLRHETDFFSWPQDTETGVAVTTANFAQKKCYRVEMQRESESHYAKFYDINTGLQAGAIWSANAIGKQAEFRITQSNHGNFGDLFLPGTIVRTRNGREQIFTITSACVTNAPAWRYDPPNEVRTRLKPLPRRQKQRFGQH